jgi:GTP-binding protein
MIDVSSSSGRDPVQDYEVISRELELFPGRDASGERLADKPVIVAANKIDVLDEPERLDRLRAHLQTRGIPLYAVSAATGDGLAALLEAAWSAVTAARDRAATDASASDSSSDTSTGLRAASGLPRDE